MQIFADAGDENKRLAGRVRVASIETHRRHVDAELEGHRDQRNHQERERHYEHRRHGAAERDPDQVGTNPTISNAAVSALSTA